VNNFIDSKTSEYGLEIVSASNCNVEENYISNAYLHGVYVADSSGCLIKENTIVNCDFYGMLLINSEKNRIYANTIKNAAYCGIKLSDSSYNILVENNILYTQGSLWEGEIVGIGIEIYYSDNNLIYHNNFIENLENARSDGSVNFWDNGVKGNYWSDYEGADLDGDGIGDTPYIIDSNNMDHYPLMKPWSMPTMPTFTLNVQSEPVKGVPIKYSGDLVGTETTDFSIGPETSPFTLTLTAPLTYEDYSFSYWIIDGSISHEENEIMLTVNGDRTAVAVYIKRSKIGYKVNLLFSQQSIEKGGILNAYFQVLKYDESGEVYPIYGIPVELETPFGSQVLESINHLGVDGIIVASYDLSNYQDDSFSIYIHESSYNGLPVNPPSVNPVIFDISERMSKIEFGTVQPGSVTLGLHVEGVCGQTFVIKTDGESVNDISYSELWKGGIGVEYNLFKAKLGVIHLDAGVKLSGGLLTSIEYYLSGSSETEKQQILKHLITKWILTNIISYAELSPSSPVSASLLKAARALIDAELDRLGFYENSEKTLTPGGYVHVSSGAEAWIGLSSKYGTLDVGKIAYAGASGEAELEGLINVYSPSKFGFVGKFDFEAGIGAGLNLDLGFLKIGGEVSAFRSEVALMSELIYEDGQFTSLKLEFAFELPTYVYDFLDFYGLAKPFQQLMKLYWPSGPVALVVHYSIPVGKLTEDILSYLSSLDVGTVEVETIFNHILNLVATTPIEYSVSLRQKANVNVGIGLGIGGLSFDVGWEYEQTTEYIVEQGVLYNFQKWPTISYTQRPKEIDVIDFIKDHWTYDGQHPQPSGTVIQLNENQQHLYLHIYNAEGKHIGLDYETNITENEIPNSYYFDNENGTITVVLPSTTTNFSVIIDGTYAREDRESYNLTVVALSSERADYKVVSGEIQKGTVKGYKINIPETGSPIATENKAPTAQFTYSPNNPKAKQEIQFTDQSSDIDGKIISWFWDFGDGTNSTLPNPKHIYQKPGTYQVTLRIIDDGFISQTITKTVTIQPETTILQDPKILSIIIISIIVIFLISIFAMRRKHRTYIKDDSLAYKTSPSRIYQNHPLHLKLLIKPTV